MSKNLKHNISTYDKNWLRVSEISFLTGYPVKKLMKDAIKIKKEKKLIFDLLHKEHRDYPNIYFHRVNFFEYYKFESDLKVNKDLKRYLSKLNYLYHDHVSLAKELNFYLDLAPKSLHHRYKYYIPYLSNPDIGKIDVKIEIITVLKKLHKDPEKYSVQYYLNSHEWITTQEASNIKLEQNYTITSKSIGSIYKRAMNKDKNKAYENFRKVGHRIFVRRDFWTKYFGYTSDIQKEEFERLYYLLEEKFGELILRKYLNITVKNQNFAKVSGFLKRAFVGTNAKNMNKYYKAMKEIEFWSIEDLKIYMRKKHFEKIGLDYSLDWITIQEAMSLYNLTYNTVIKRIKKIEKIDPSFKKVFANNLMYIEKDLLEKYTFDQKYNWRSKNDC